MLLAGLLFPSGALGGAVWYDFNEPYASALAPETVVFDWTTDRCGDDSNIPDQPARAFRNDIGQVNLIATHHTARRALGARVDTAVPTCNVVMTSTEDPDPSRWDHDNWISSPYTRDGTTVYSLSHMEYRGWKYDTSGTCTTGNPTWAKCWYNVITLLKSTNGGATFSSASPPPTQFVGGIPYRYAVGIGPSGFMNPSNIVRGRDGYYYTIVHVEPHDALQAKGACLWRTQDLSDPKSWRAWSGSGFNVRFLDPYVNNISDPAQHVCALVGANTIETGAESLTWSTYFKKWLLVRAAGGGAYPAGFYAYTSDDLINWGQGTLLVNAKLPWAHTCGDPDYLEYPSLLDPESKSRNFETTGQRPTLFFTHFHVVYDSPTHCYMGPDRDLLRIPIELSNQQPGGPAASLSASTTSAQTGETVTFDASRSRDADGTIVKYEWDLDGNGTYERTGTSPVTQTAYDAPDSVTVTVRVSDNDGKATDDTRIVHVTGAGPGSSGGAVEAGPPGGAVPRPVASAAVARFRLVGKPRMRRDGSFTLRVQAPGAGRLLVRAAGAHAAIRTARRFAAKPGILVVRVKPSARGRALVSERGKLSVRTAVTFTPVGGAPQSATRTIVMRPPAAS